MTGDSARHVNDVNELLRLVEDVRTRVLWKASGRKEALVGMEHHQIEPIPEEGLSIGLAVARTPAQLSARVSVVVHSSGVYVRADTATTYNWAEQIDVSDECARELLRRDGVQRALATSCAHVVEAATAVGADIENPALRFQDEVLDMVNSDSVFD